MSYDFDELALNFYDARQLFNTNTPTRIRDYFTGELLYEGFLEDGKINKFNDYDINEISAENGFLLLRIDKPND